MAKPQPEHHTVRFGVFELDLRAGELRKRGLKVKLQGMPIEILAVLLERPGEVVTREELRRRLWPEDTFVDFDNSLNSAVNRLREALGDSADNPRFVETLPRRGYRFIAPVEQVEAAPPQPLTASQAPAERFPATEPSFRRWMAGLAGVGLVAIMLGVAYWVTHRAPQPATSASGRVMLAVLPFKNLSGNPEQDYFSDGLTEEMITHLGRLRPERLGVIASTSAMRYKGSDSSIDQIGQELAVSYILEGSVRREQERVRITAQLIQVSDQTQLWAEIYDRDPADVLDIQREVAERIVRSLALELLPAQQVALARAPTTSTAAYDAYLKGRYHWNKRTPQTIRKGIEFFQQAIAEDPNFALAYVGLADAYNFLGGLGSVPPKQAFPKAKEAALKALELDDTLAEAHATLAMVKLQFDYDWDGAGEEFARALELNPGLVTAHLWHGCYLTALKRHDQAIAEAQRARQLDPFSIAVNVDTGWYYLFARRYDQAIQQCRRTLELEPTFAFARVCVQLAYMQKGQYQEAFAEAQQLLTFYGANQEQVAALGDSDPEIALKNAWQWQLRGLQESAKKRHVSPYFFALHYVVLGQYDRAMKWLDKAYENRDSQLVYLKVDPVFDPLRSDSRFQDLLRRMNFPEN